MSKAGNPYLRYYFGEAANSIRSTSLNMLISMPENMLRYPNISTKEHSRLHLVNLYDSFWIAGQKPTVHRRKAGHRTQYRIELTFGFLNTYRRSIKVTLFSEKHIKIFFKKFLTYHQNAFMIWLRRKPGRARPNPIISVHLHPALFPHTVSTFPGYWYNNASADPERRFFPFHHPSG